MKKLFNFAAISVLSLSLAGCGSDNSRLAAPDLGEVLDRTVSAIVFLQDALVKRGVTKPTDQHLDELGTFMQTAMNAQPPVHPSPVGIKLLKDATFAGYNDSNGDGIQGTGEKQFFTVEVDFDGKRLIASSEGRSTGSSMGSGILTGLLMGHLLGRQRGAGVKSGHFANRNVQPRASYKRPTRTGSPARSRARSGGRFGGK